MTLTITLTLYYYDFLNNMNYPELYAAEECILRWRDRISKEILTYYKKLFPEHSVNITLVAEESMSRAGKLKIDLFSIPEIDTEYNTWEQEEKLIESVSTCPQSEDYEWTLKTREASDECWKHMYPKESSDKQLGYCSEKEISDWLKRKKN